MKNNYTNLLLSSPPYSLDKFQKDSLLVNALRDLTLHHLEQCPPYKKIYKHLNQSKNWSLSELHSIPFIPVRLFKEMDMLSIKRQEVFKTMLSSGTSGQSPSRIYLDRETARLQTLGLSQLMKAFFPIGRPPMLIIDSPETISNRSKFSARAAGILGFSFFGRTPVFALNSDLTVNEKALSEFYEAHCGEEILIFGFTSIIWEHFLNSTFVQSNSFSMPKAYVLHGGGWKKLANLGITNIDFKQQIFNVLQTNKVVNYYGLVEQTGSLFFECERNFLHSSNFSNVIVREPTSFEAMSFGVTGLLQLQSIFPLSYPGHSLLTEDLGTIYGVDDCTCGRKGQRFIVHGRAPDAELRGCSDTLSR